MISDRDERHLILLRQKSELNAGAQLTLNSHHLFQMEEIG